eukprot:5122703-Karenia_brevis.AAC.1
MGAPSAKYAMASALQCMTCNGASMPFATQGFGGHKLQWYKGVLYCALCGAWTKSKGQPKLLVDTCKGKKPMG